MKQTYIRCPRCELNYILKREKFCNVCKQEMKALGTLGAEENLDLELCPLCKINYINPDEDVCPSCAKERELEDGEESVGKYGSESEWDAYTNPDDDDTFEDEETGDMVSISNLDDTSIDDDDMDLGLDVDEDDAEDEAFDSDFDDSFGNIDDDLDDDDLDEDDIDEDDEIEELPKKKKRK